MKFDVMTLFPDMVRTVLAESIVGRGEKAGCFSTAVHNIRDYSEDHRHRVDDTPYGGGMGMVLQPDPVYRCWRHVMDGADGNENVRTVYLSPKGCVFTQEKAKELLQYDRLILLCGHYEGIDERVLDEIVDEEISVGDYVLTGGELPACIVVDCVCRMLPGVLAAPECYEDESIASGLLEYPQYTRPPVYHGRTVPDVLLSGDHGAVNAWRQDTAFLLTDKKRPDLITPEARAAYDARHAPKKRHRSGSAGKKSVPKVESSPEQERKGTGD